MKLNPLWFSHKSPGLFEHPEPMRHCDIIVRSLIWLAHLLYCAIRESWGNSQYPKKIWLKAKDLRQWTAINYKEWILQCIFCELIMISQTSSQIVYSNMCLMLNHRKQSSCMHIDIMTPSQRPFSLLEEAFALIVLNVTRFHHIDNWSYYQRTKYIFRKYMLVFYRGWTFFVQKGFRDLKKWNDTEDRHKRFLFTFSLGGPATSRLCLLWE